MRKKIILGIVILIVLAAVGGAVYFNINYAIVCSAFYEDDHKYFHYFERKDVTYFWGRYTQPFENDDIVLSTPSLKRFTKIKRLSLSVDEKTNLKYLSKMNELEELELFYFDGCAGQLETRLETLPELPKLKKMTMWAKQAESLYSILPYRVFELENENYNFSNIETLSLETFEVVDFDSIKHFKNLKNLYVLEDSLTNKEIEELQSRGINVEIV